MLRTALALALTGTAVVLAAEVDVTVDHLPEECTRKTAAGDFLSMHYTGTIDESSAAGEKGSQFDSSVGRGPFEFTLGQGMVIKGWDEGLLDMCVGEKRTLVIPPELGYGERGAGGAIPGGATLKFTVECLDIKDPPEGGSQPEDMNIFAEIDANGDKVIDEDELNAWFKSKRQMDVPEDLWENEDKDGDRQITWEEFSGPKGSSPDDL